MIFSTFEAGKMTNQQQHPTDETLKRHVRPVVNIDD